MVVIVDFDGDGDVEEDATFDEPAAECGRWARHAQLSAFGHVPTSKIARGEAMECAASLDVMRLRKLLSDERYEHGLRLLEGVVAMLTKML